MFIALEGIDGTGKSTLAARLAQLLPGPVRHTWEPTRSSDGLRALELARAGKHTEAGHYFLRDRHHHLTTTIYPAIDRGWWVICDRYALSTAVYQGRDDDHALEIARWHRDRPGWWPDLTVVLDAPLAELRRRLRARGGSEAEGDLERSDKMANRHRLYRRLASWLSSDGVRLVDATLHPAALDRSVAEALIKARTFRCRECGYEADHVLFVEHDLCADCGGESLTEGFGLLPRPQTPEETWGAVGCCCRTPDRLQCAELRGGQDLDEACPCVCHVTYEMACEELEVL